MKRLSIQHAPKRWATLGRLLTQESWASSCLFSFSYTSLQLSWAPILKCFEGAKNAKRSGWNVPKTVSRAWVGRGLAHRLYWEAWHIEEALMSCLWAAYELLIKNWLWRTYEELSMNTVNHRLTSSRCELWIWASWGLSCWTLCWSILKISIREALIILELGWLKRKSAHFTESSQSSCC